MSNQPQSNIINMESSNFDQQAKHIVSEIKDIIESKGQDLDTVLASAGISKEDGDKIFSGETVPSLTQFLALCEISGITIKLPSVETPNNPM